MHANHVPIRLVSVETPVDSEYAIRILVAQWES